MNELIIFILEKIGYLGVFLLVSIENVFPPIPSEIILIFAGFMTTYTNLNIVVMIIISTLASYFGAILLYLIGKILNRDRIERMIDGKLGKITKIEKKDIDKVVDYFNKKGTLTIFMCRFIPLIRSLISIPAGMSNMNFIKFSIYTIMGTFIWNATLIVLGKIVGNNWHIVADIFNNYSTFILIIIGILLLIFIPFYYKKRYKSQ